MMNVLVTNGSLTINIFKYIIRTSSRGDQDQNQKEEKRAGILITNSNVEAAIKRVKNQNPPKLLPKHSLSDIRYYLLPPIK